MVTSNQTEAMIAAGESRAREIGVPVDLEGAEFIRNNVALGVGFEFNRALLAEFYRSVEVPLVRR